MLSLFFLSFSGQIDDFDVHDIVWLRDASTRHPLHRWRFSSGSSSENSLDIAVLCRKK